MSCSNGYPAPGLLHGSRIINHYFENGKPAKAHFHGTVTNVDSVAALRRLNLFEAGLRLP